MIHAYVTPGILLAVSMFQAARPRNFKTVLFATISVK